MSRTKRTHKDEFEPSLKSHRRQGRTERLKEFEAEYIRKNKIPIITL